MTDLWSDLLACLELRPEEDSVFEGGNQRLGYHRLFGGQLLAQFVRAAALACPGRTVKSVHTLFARAGRPDEPVRYEVTVHHEGGTFATLAIVARQSPGVMATASVSMHALEAGPDHQTPFHVPVVPGEEHSVDLDLLPWETRAATGLDTPKAKTPEYELWMRTPAVRPELAPALTAYATDLSLIGTALRQVEGVGQHDANTAFTAAVTAHTVSFHRPLRTDSWLLLRQHAPLLAHGRCYGRGDVLTAEGSLVASYAQEALLRFKN
ncbi:acyl-CoA thioesterase [Streptomyces sp. AK08-02]|uniref:acyl-CoA thioesterase n=1 Tax=Streptomyces sp. AK08-02 TaxID=3028654 RepID=UPI0029B34CEE|nr:acyl-CoA thioesterase domain-containing protein [Streptomyces sp. AK08-02]MDX3745488.1 thioesterase family protein [Streptomyces sp. AK08-02]